MVRIDVAFHDQKTKNGIIIAHVSLKSVYLISISNYKNKG